jgi:hypothetical protein
MFGASYRIISTIFGVEHCFQVFLAVLILQGPQSFGFCSLADAHVVRQSFGWVLVQSWTLAQR